MASILEEAQDLIHGDRAKQYGPPSANFIVITKLWSAYLCGKYKLDLVLEPEDYAMLMILAKTARTATGNKKRDDIVDIAGYAGTVEMVRDYEVMEAGQAL